MRTETAERRTVRVGQTPTGRTDLTDLFGEAELRCRKGYPQSPSSVSVPGGLLNLSEPVMGRFKVERMLHDGRTHSVYLAKDGENGQDIVLKAVAVPRSADAASRGSFEYQADLHRRASRLPGVLRAYGFLRMPATGDHDIGVLVMEYADGGSLRDWLAAREYDVDTRREHGLDRFRDVCACIGALHGEGIWHLGINPGNLLLVKNALKVSGFGSAYAHADGTAATSADGARQERGTVSYMSPEQMRATSPEQPDERADIYALGCLLHEIVSPRCRPPFVGSEDHVRKLQQTGRIAPVEGVGDGVRRVLARALAKDPGQRYRSVGELLDDLDLGVVASGRGSTTGLCHLPAYGDACQSSRLPAVPGDYATTLEVAARLIRQDTEMAPIREMLQSVRASMEDLSCQLLAEVFALVVEASGHYSEIPTRPVLRVESLRRTQAFATAVERGLSAAKRGDYAAAKAFAQEAKRANPASALADWLSNSCEARTLGQGPFRGRVGWPAAGPALGCQLLVQGSGGSQARNGLEQAAADRDPVGRFFVALKRFLFD